MLTLAPALQAQRDLLDLPRGMERFEPYVDTMIDRATDTVKLPLGVFNPMSKEHVAALLDVLIGIEAEAIAQDVIGRANATLPVTELDIAICLVVADDAEGGWTNRFITDFEYRYTERGVIPGWVQVLLWSSEGAEPDHVRATVARSIYRDVHSKTHGIPATLRQMLEMEALASSFAGGPERHLDPDDIAYTLEVIAPHLDSDERPTIMACLYGDDAARSVGYQPLGLSPWAGLAAVAAMELLDDGGDRVP
jgi:hypothetical protein